MKKVREGNIVYNIRNKVGICEEKDFGSVHEIEKSDNIQISKKN